MVCSDALGASSLPTMQPHVCTPLRVCSAPADKLLCALLKNLSFVHFICPSQTEGRRQKDVSPPFMSPHPWAENWKHKARCVHSSAMTLPGKGGRLLGQRPRGDTGIPCAREAGTHGRVGRRGRGGRAAHLQHVDTTPGITVLLQVLLRAHNITDN